MYARRFKCRNQNWSFLFKRSLGLTRLGDGHSIHSRSITNFGWEQRSKDKLMKNYHDGATIGSRYFFRDCTTTRCIGTYNPSFTFNCSRFFSSKGDESNASDGKHVPVIDSTHSDKGKPRREKNSTSMSHCNDHARLGEHDQLEWLNSERLSIESKRKESSFLTRCQRFKNEIMRRLIPCDKINVSWDTFPYYVHDNTRKTLVECARSHLKNNKFATLYGGSLVSSSGRILLQSSPGMELYLERLVRALAQDMQVPLLVLDGSVLAPFGFGEELVSEVESDGESGEECTSGSDAEEENDASNEEEWASENEAKSDGTEEDDVDAKASIEVLKRLVPYDTIEDFAKRVSGEPDCDSSASENSSSTENTDQSKQTLKKGDRVKYVGSVLATEDEIRPVSSGMRGEVHDVNGEQVAVILDTNNEMKTDKEMESAEDASKPSIVWFPVKDIVHDHEIQAEDWFIALEALSEALPQLQPLILYFPDPSQWLSRAVPKSKRKEFIHKIEEMFDQLSGPIVLICGQNKSESTPKEKDKLTMVFPNIRLGRLPVPLRQLTESLTSTKTAKDEGLYKLFDNVLFVHPPKEEELLKVFNKQLEEDGKIVALRRNLYELQKVLGEHDLTCLELLNMSFHDVNLTKLKAEKVVGWARNHYLASCAFPSTKSDKLVLPHVSLEEAISRLKEQETAVRKPVQSLKALAKDEYESNFVSAVVPPDEIGVKFNDVGALEDVKRTLNELVILPMRRPELFSQGNLLRPCKGILLFGPPGTGKTLLAKALATEAGANFISITGSTLTSKWFGDAEKLTKALFSYAAKLAPVIIFVDEVDSLLGARGGAFEHEATRRMRNEFMAAWDGLRTKDSQKILILGATNRPFDLDDAVIRRLPRRIYIDLPDADNRKKILKIFLAHENLDPSFRYDELANATDGYSGSDLKNLCTAAAYRPVQELLEEEKKIGAISAAPLLRPLCMDDFLQAKAKVGASVAYDATSMNELRKWNDQYGEGGSRKRNPFGFAD